MAEQEGLEKVRLKRAEFNLDLGGKVPAGGVVEVPKEMADRLRRSGLVDDGTLDKNERNWAEQRLADIEAEKHDLHERIRRDSARSAAWDVELRDVSRHEADAKLLQDAAQARVERAEAAQALFSDRPEGPGPGSVNTAPQDRQYLAEPTVSPPETAMPDAEHFAVRRGRPPKAEAKRD